MHLHSKSLLYALAKCWHLAEGTTCKPTARHGRQIPTFLHGWPCISWFYCQSTMTVPSSQKHVFLKNICPIYRSVGTCATVDVHHQRKQTREGPRKGTRKHSSGSNSSKPLHSSLSLLLFPQSLIQTDAK